MNIKLLKKIKQINRVVNSNVKPVSNAEIIVTPSTVQLNTEGMFSTMIIEYTGAVYFKRLCGILVKILSSKNTILITNLFKQNIRNDIFQYYGDLKITHCKIMNFDQTYIVPKITNLTQQSFISSSKTNFEDNDEMLYDVKKKSKRFRGARGSDNPRLSSVSYEKILSKSVTKQDAYILSQTVTQALSNANLIKTIKEEPAKQQGVPTPAIVSQDVPKHSVADKFREASFAKGEKAPKDKGGY